MKRAQPARAPRPPPPPAEPPVDKLASHPDACPCPRCVDLEKCHVCERLMLDVDWCWNCRRLVL